MLITKMKKVYHACVLSTLSLSSETWIPYSYQKCSLNIFYQVAREEFWAIHNKTTSPKELFWNKQASQVCLLSSSSDTCDSLAMLTKWMIAKSKKTCYTRELATSTRTVGRPARCERDVCKYGMKASDISRATWEAMQ